MPLLCTVHNQRQCQTRSVVVQNALMASPAQRLKRAREMAGYQFAVDAAEAMRMPEQTYLSHESGHRGFRGKAARYAGFFRVSLVWLLEGVGEPKDNQEES